MKHLPEFGLIIFMIETPSVLEEVLHLTGERVLVQTIYQVVLITVFLNTLLKS